MAYGTRGWWTAERQSYAVEYLKQNAGLSDVGARGLVSRWVNVESPGGPSAVNPISGAEGIAQWLDRKGGYKLGDFESQLAHAAQELNSNEKRAGDALRAAQTDAQAAVGATMFERAAGWNPKTGTDNFTAQTQAGIGRIATRQEDIASADFPLTAATRNLSTGYPTTTASLLLGGGGSDALLGASRAQAPVMPTASVGGGQPLSPYVRGDFFPTPAPTLQPHLTAPGGYAPTITAIQPYSTQPSPEVLAAAYQQRDASYAQPQYDIGPTVQREPVGPAYVPHEQSSMSPYARGDFVPAASLPIAPSDFTLSDLMHAQSGGVGQDIFGAGQAPAAAPMPGGTPAPVAPVGHRVHDVIQHIVQNVVPNLPSIFQHLTGGAQGPGITGPLPAGVSPNNAMGALQGGQSWHAPSLYNSSGGINPSGGSSYNYFTPSSPGGIGGYMTSSGHIYTYPTDPDIYHSVAS